jgi:selenocysteine lyase/cysteine desulfurase
VLGCAVEDVAITTSTSDGIGRVLAGLDLGPDDEVLTSDQEHPGLIGPLIAARRRGAAVRAVPMRELADAVGPATTLVACSHVNWITGETAPAELAQMDVPVVLDGAQGVGAVPIDLQALGCAAYAASGQKWLCGADGTGMLYLAPAFRARVRMIAPGYLSLHDVSRGLESDLRGEAQAWGGPISREAAAFSLGALRVLEAAGWHAVHRRAAALAAELAERLQDAGRRVVPRAATTLVSFEDPDPPETRTRLAEAGVAVRDLPGTPLLRASVGAWNDESDLERLLAALG